MKRNIQALGSQVFDLVVVGAGVYGAAVAWDAALRGLSVALVDKGDFGGATSFNNFKTIHGGLRYLQHGDLLRMRESVRERRVLMKIAPHLVHPLPFLVPTYREWKRGRLAMAAALWLNDLVSFDRNRLADPEKFIPTGRLISRSDCMEVAPGVRTEGLTGGAIWYDAQMHNSDRLTLCYILSAADAGAVAANHMEATGFLKEGDRIVGIQAKDHLGGNDLDVRARVVLNATGPWVDHLLSRLNHRAGPRLFHFSKAINVVTRSLLEETALGLSCRRLHRDRDAWIETGARFLFIVPWRRCSLIGTRHTVYRGQPDDLETTDEDVQELLDDINQAYPGAGLERQDVRLIHRGLLPMVPASHHRNDVTLVKKYLVRDHRCEGIEGLISMVGVKYTTARDVADKAVNRVFDSLGKKPPSSRSAETPLHGGRVERFDAFLASETKRRPGGLSEEVVRHLVYTYGSAYPEILAHIETDPEGAKPVTDSSPVLEAEILHAVREEQATDLESVVLRRTELGSAGHPGRDCLEKVTRILSRELEWSEAKARSEINKVEKFYRCRS